jgi:hypothetical protein
MLGVVMLDVVAPSAMPGHEKNALAVWNKAFFRKKVYKIRLGKRV